MAHLLQKSQVYGDQRLSVPRDIRTPWWRPRALSRACELPYRRCPGISTSNSRWFDRGQRRAFNGPPIVCGGSRRPLMRNRPWHLRARLNTCARRVSWNLCPRHSRTLRLSFKFCGRRYGSTQHTHCPTSRLAVSMRLSRCTSLAGRLPASSAWQPVPLRHARSNECSARAHPANGRMREAFGGIAATPTGSCSRRQPGLRRLPRHTPLPEELRQRPALRQSPAGTREQSPPGAVRRRKNGDGPRKSLRDFTGIASEKLPLQLRQSHEVLNHVANVLANGFRFGSLR